MKHSRFKRGRRFGGSTGVRKGTPSGRPVVRVKKYELTRDRKSGRFSKSGKKEKYVSVFRRSKKYHTKSGAERYERLSTVREKVTGTLLNFNRNQNDVGFHVRNQLANFKIYSILKREKPKGLLVKIKGRKRGAKKDTTALIRVFLEPDRNTSKKYLEKVLTAKILNGLRDAGLRTSTKNKRNKDFEYLGNAQIKVEYYG